MRLPAYHLGSYGNFVMMLMMLMMMMLLMMMITLTLISS